MAYGRSRRRYDPRADERRAREAAFEERVEKDRRDLAELLREHRQVRLKGPEARRVWENEPKVKSYATGKMADGSTVQTIVLGVPDEQLYLQVPGFDGWRFFRLVPRYHVPRSEEVDDEDGRDRSRSSRPAVRVRLHKGHHHVVLSSRPNVAVTGPLTRNEAKRWLRAYRELTPAAARREIQFRTRRRRA